MNGLMHPSKQHLYSSGEAAHAGEVTANVNGVRFGGRDRKIAAEVRVALRAAPPITNAKAILLAPIR
jgi:hypothetical protein